MLVNDLLRSLLRRWYIVLPGLALTIAAVFGVHAWVPVAYKSTATLVLLPPEKSVEEGDNPYLYLGGLGQALNILVITMNSAESKESIVQERIGLEYVLEQDATTTGPILNITTVAPTAEQSLNLAQEVVAQVPLTLATLQNELDVPENAQIGTMKLAASTKAATENRRQLQLMVGTLGAGVVGTVLTVAAIDRRLNMSRRSRKSPPKNNNSTGSPSSPPNDPATTKESYPRQGAAESKLKLQPTRFIAGT